MSALTTTAPSAANCMATARPIPELAPVTMAIFPESHWDMGLPKHTGSGPDMTLARHWISRYPA
jgi:hypothetical protein